MNPPAPEADLFVVETLDGDAYIGQLVFSDDDVTVYNGYRGRPPVISRHEVSAITPVEDHPDVVATPLFQRTDTVGDDHDGQHQR